jgi:hypothetical protein
MSIFLIGAIVLGLNFAAVPGKAALAGGLILFGLATAVAFILRQRRLDQPLYDIKIASRPIFWVAATAGIIIFGSLMAAMFIGQQFLQNVLSYSTLDAGAAILPAAIFMVLVAPRSAKLVELKGARFTMLFGYVFCMLGFVTMLLFWKEGIPYWKVGLAYAFMGIGVGLAGTPASHSLTGSVPVRKAGMASATADLQRDLGGAIMQSILGALLTAGYATAIAAAVSSSPNADQVTSATENQLTKSFDGATAIAAQYPQYSSAIVSAAKQSFIDGQDLAYTAGIVAILLGALLVFFKFPKKDDEQRTLLEYASEDRASNVAT